MNRVIAIGLDGADPHLVEKWTDDGSLPNLRSLRQRGSYCRLFSDAGLMAESTHYCFYTGQNPAAHGGHCYEIWRAEEMTLAPPSMDWLPLHPFWRSFRQDDPRAIVLDVPLVYAPEPFHGVEIIGWATHDTLIPFTTHPPRLANWIRSRFGHSLMSDEHYGLQRKADFINTRDEMLTVARGFRDLVLELMKKEPWDLLLAFLFSAHHGGHRLWDLRNITDPLNDTERAELSDALRQIYIACDEAIGHLVEAAGPETTVMVFSLHGMQENSSRNWILPEMLGRILDGKSPDASSTRKNRISQIRELIPGGIRYRIKSKLPFRLRRWLTRYWRTTGFKWEETKAFCAMSDTQGWIRVNLKGREAKGIVDPGEEFEALCRKISEGLKTYADADTGKPLVKDILRPHQIFSGEKLDRLPDLIAIWDDSPAAQHHAVTSPEFGLVPWPTPGRNPEGRSGNHRAQGILLMAGGGIPSGNMPDANILDLAPTILTLLGQPVPERMEGSPISLYY